MIRRIYVVTFVLTFFTIIKPMELEEFAIAPALQSSLVELLENAEPVLGGVAETIDQTEVLAHQDQLIALKHVMSSIIDGLEINDDQLVVPGFINLIPLYRASEWIQAAFHLAEKKHYEGSEFVTSNDYTIRDCQMMLKKLWQYGLCLDLEAADPKEAERLYSNRMTRIGALLNYTDPNKQDVNLLKEYAKIQVLQALPSVLPSVPLYPYVHVDVATAFEQSAISLSSHAKKGKKTSCFTRCISKNKHQEKRK